MFGVIRYAMAEPALPGPVPATCLYSLVLTLLTLPYYAQPERPIGSYVHITLHLLLHSSLSLQMLIPLPGMPFLWFGHLKNNSSWWSKGTNLKKKNLFTLQNLNQH